MRIVEALQCESFRIVCGSRWLHGDGLGNWEVYEREHGTKKTKLILVTRDENEAVEALRQ